ncbi:hypothetical protein CTAM01_16154 [Colletotrichum tamarilloi]|uniref:Uncharacterized protein n=1 Tax=Colletotrichum tamarilloi TaxID=1209934 RepID=A0ABQ9QJD7_9PEZI|nr:uncharacterized protein CTAM01_16154 [Colletotrichum tamarilloi]KAK1473248.1 hypothetical protein CTAM01_16154 [Colletotrichum tamarilloi]
MCWLGALPTPRATTWLINLAPLLFSHGSALLSYQISSQGESVTRSILAGQLSVDDLFLDPVVEGNRGGAQTGRQKKRRKKT